jgi:hypothetical protein
VGWKRSSVLYDIDLLGINQYATVRMYFIPRAAFSYISLGFAPHINIEDFASIPDDIFLNYYIEWIFCRLNLFSR